MKLILTAAALLFVTHAGAQNPGRPSKKILVAYYSYSGNTRVIAEQIKAMTGADLLEILPETAYPSEYDAVVEQAKKEINADYKPPLKTTLPDLDGYDIIFIGSPNWWSTIAPPVAAFLSKYDLSDKTIVPFMTHGGGRMGHAVADIGKLCPGSDFLEALPIPGNRVQTAEKEVRNWLRKINIID